MGEPSIEEIADGMALWDEHKPQSGEDWVAVAERFVADGCTTENSSPLFAAVVLAVEQRDQLDQQVEALLSAVDDLLKLRLGRGPGHAGRPYLPDNWETRGRLQELNVVANQVRKERGDA